MFGFVLRSKGQPVYCWVFLLLFWNESAAICLSLKFFSLLILLNTRCGWCQWCSLHFESCVKCEKWKHNGKVPVFTFAWNLFFLTTQVIFMMRKVLNDEFCSEIESWRDISQGIKEDKHHHSSLARQSLPSLRMSDISSTSNSCLLPTFTSSNKEHQLRERNLRPGINVHGEV